ncbi:F-box domain-containing protein [Mycena chlorophos]|uniref:F-box domain-containing protein n=1 Tax=Mycena chlorophos TaxID=658473 RepID=A0A8H6SAF8_MYCCL|nr:F-box domain-containing protein [Mycena chlorophos]
MTGTKRKRLDSEERIAGPIVRSAVWFSDGNVILQAERRYFRVYRGTLALHSSDLETRIDEAEDEPLRLEGCPVVVVVTDAAEDVECVLQKYFHAAYSNGDPIPFDVVASFLRIARSWGIDSLFDEAYDRLEQCLPTTLKTWNHNHYRQLVALEPSPFAWLILVCNIMKLARELGLHELLPAGFLFLSFPNALAGALPHLPTSDAQTVLRGTPAVNSSIARHAMNWLNGDTAGCLAPPHCAMVKQTTRMHIWHPTGSMYGMSLAHWHGAWVNGLCPRCAGEGRKQYAERMALFWEELPGIFGLGSWEELKGDDGEVNGNEEN